MVVDVFNLTFVESCNGTLVVVRSYLRVCVLVLNNVRNIFLPHDSFDTHKLSETYISGIFDVVSCHLS